MDGRETILTMEPNFVINFPERYKVKFLYTLFIKTITTIKLPEVPRPINQQSNMSNKVTNKTSILYVLQKTNSHKDPNTMHH